MIKRILLLPVDDDPEAAGVLRAIAIADAAGAEVEIFDTVYEPLLEGYMGSDVVARAYAPLRERLINESVARREALAKSLRRKGLACESQAVWSAHRHEAINGKVIAGEIDVVVTQLPDPDHGLSHEDWTLISTCPAAMLLVRNDGKQSYGHVVAAVDPYHEHGKPAELDSLIVRYAKAFADLGGGDVKVAHCFTPVAEFARDHAANLPVADAEAALEAARRGALEHLVVEADLPKNSAVLLSGRPEKALRSMAERGQADLFVVGVASRGRLREFFIGSTARRLLRSTVTDMLVIKPPGFKVGATLNPAPRTSV